MPTSLSDLDARAAELRARIRELSARYEGRRFPDDVREQWNQLNAELQSVDDTRRELQARRDRLASFVDNPNALERADGGAAAIAAAYQSLGRHRPAAPGLAGLADSARRLLDLRHAAGDLPADAAGKVERLLGVRDVQARHAAQQWLLAAGDPAYERAFARLLVDPVNGHREWDAEELAAYRRVQEVRNLAVGGDGGLMVPVTLDPAIMLTNDGSVDPLRRLARVVQTSTNSWKGVTSEGVTAEWLGPDSAAREMADASPTLDGPEIPVHLGDAFVPFSFEWGMDATNALQELRRLLVDAADQLMAAAHINGTGAAQPTGLTVGLAAGSKVPTAAADTLAADDVYALQEALPPRFQTDAAWLSNLSVANTIAQFETGNGAKQFPELADGRLLRKPWNEANYLASPGDTASAGNDHILAYGDFGRGYVIVDRIGTTIEVVPHLFGANRRPTGQRGAIMWFRSGADVVVDNAIRILTA